MRQINDVMFPESWTQGNPAPTPTRRRKPLPEVPRDRQYLITNHMPMARAMAWRLLGYGVSLEDLQQEAYFGLCEAVLRYEEQEDATFQAYARFWCRKKMMEAIRDYGSPVRLPSNLQCELRFYSLDEDENQKGEEDDSKADRLLAGPARDIEAENEVRLAQLQRIDEAMACLKEQQRKVVSMVHGLDGQPRSLTEVSRELGLSQARTGIIYRTAMDHLRTALKARPLTGYLYAR